jgi:hypothetical protein
MTAASPTWGYNVKALAPDTNRFIDEGEGELTEYDPMNDSTDRHDPFKNE